MCWRKKNWQKKTHAFSSVGLPAAAPGRDGPGSPNRDAGVASVCALRMRSTRHLGVRCCCVRWAGGTFLLIRNAVQYAVQVYVPFRRNLSHSAISMHHAYVDVNASTPHIVRACQRSLLFPFHIQALLLRFPRLIHSTKPSTAWQLVSSVAHRGGRENTPENSMRAFSNSLDVSQVTKKAHTYSY